MKRIFNYILSSTLLLGALSCGEDEILDQWIADNPPAEEVPLTGDPGNLDLSNLVVLGTSLASGIQDGALFNAGQAGSFPNLLGTHFQIDGLGGTTAFGQPSINSENGYHMIYANGAGRTQLDLSLRAPVATTGDVASILTPWGGTTSTLNNFAVPLTQAVQLITPATGGPVTTTYGGGVSPAMNPAYNPFYRRFASSPSPDGSSGSSPMTDALSAGGSFFIYEAGLNDIVLWAAGGGTTAFGPMTASANYNAYSNMAIKALASAGTTLTPATDVYSVEGVVLNVPPILVFPFFQAVKYNVIPMDQATADGANSGFASYNGGLDLAYACGQITNDERLARKINFTASSTNALVIEDKTLTAIVIPQDCAGPGVPASDTPLPKYRQATSSDIIVLTAGAVIGTLADPNNAASVIGVGVPLADNYVLLPSEQQTIEVARAQYNGYLAATVTEVNTAGGDIALVDIASIFLDAAGLSDGVQGITVQGLNLSPDFAPNGIFSTDGIHPCQRGHAIIANKIISTMNAEWGSSIPEISVAPILGPYFIP